METMLNLGNPSIVNYRQMLKETREHAKDTLNMSCPHLMQEDIRPLASAIARAIVNFIRYDNGDLFPVQTLRTCAKLDTETHSCSEGKKTYLSCCMDNKCDNYVSIQDLLPHIFNTAGKHQQTHLVEEWLENLPV